MQKIKALLLSLGMLLGSVSSVTAITPTVAIQDLPQYINSDSFKLSCSALGGNNVQFAYKKEGGSYQDFGGVIDVTVNPCQVQVTNSQVNEQTRYYFRVTLDGTVADETNTYFDISGPSPVSGYYKDTIDGDDIKIHWRNPADTDFDKVIIYRGETADFSADNSHEIARVSGSPNSDMTYDEHTPDPNKQYYYALRSVDKAGNSSSLVGDGGTTTTSTITTQGTAQNGSSNVTVLPNTGQGSVLAESTEEPTATMEATVAPESGLSETLEKVNKPWILVGIGLIVLGLIFYFFKRKK